MVRGVGIVAWAFMLLTTTLSIPSSAAMEERINLSMALNMDGTAHVIIESSLVIEGLMEVLGEAAIKDAYMRRLGLVFGEIRDLEVSVGADSTLVTFNSVMAKEVDDTWVVEETALRGVLSPVSTLRVELPEGTELIGAEPQPTEIKGRTMTWRDVSPLPGITYRTQGNLAKAILATTGLLALMILLLIKKKTK